jgi:hypothetical protein
MTNIVFRRASAADYPAIVLLHRENLYTNLSDQEQKDGFLSLDISEQQLSEANEDLAVIVAIQEQSVVGYVFGTTIDYNRQFPLLKYMISLYEETKFQGRLLSNYRSFLYGPVCVAFTHRGTGLVQGLFQELLTQVAGRYEAGTAFVSKNNPRSLRAHIQKLGMEVLRDFEFKGKEYNMLGFKSAIPQKAADDLSRDWAR